jgi:hypothetical protein
MTKARVDEENEYSEKKMRESNVRKTAINS